MQKNISYDEAVSFVHELTIDGYKGAFDKEPHPIQLAVRAFVAQGLITRTYVDGGQHRLYRWVGGPLTDELRDKIVEEMRGLIRKKNRNSRLRKKEQRSKETTPEVKAEAEPAPAHIPEIPDIPSLSSFTDRQLWDELKARGWKIDDGKLKKVVIVDIDDV